MRARQARAIRRRSRRVSQNIDGLGVSELFLSDEKSAGIILKTHDLRLKCYLLGFSHIPTLVPSGSF